MKFGDLHAWNTHTHYRALRKILDNKSDKRTPYYILIIPKKGYGGPSYTVAETKDVDLSGMVVISVRMMILDYPPPVRLLNTELWRIDNKIGEARRIYALPKECPVIGTSLDDANARDSELVHKSAKGMPLVYNN